MKKAESPKNSLSRRAWFGRVRDLTIFSLFSTLLLSCTTKPVATYKEWKKTLKNRGGEGLAGVNNISGKAYLNGKELSAGDTITSGESVLLDKDSQMFISLPDQSVVKITGEAKYQLDLGSQQGGVFRLEYGSLLAVIKKNRRRRYLFRGAIAVVGIRGTVFFGHIPKPGTAMPKEFPEGVSEYFCLCNGKADYLSSGTSSVMMTDVSYHHNSYFVTQDKNGPKFKPAGILVAHSDDEIGELIDTMEGEKHDKTWLSGAPYKNY